MSNFQQNHDFPKEPISDQQIFEFAANLVNHLEGVPISQAENILKQAAFFIRAGTVVTVDPRLRDIAKKSEV